MPSLNFFCFFKKYGMVANLAFSTLFVWWKVSVLSGRLINSSVKNVKESKADEHTLDSPKMDQTSFFLARAAPNIRGHLYAT